MIKRINFTGRKKILHEDVHISIRPDTDGTLVLDSRLSLVDYELPPDAQVFVEAYRQTTFMRFLNGLVADLTPPRNTSHRLTEFLTSDGLRFRVKVTSTGSRAGVLLAEADSISACDDEEQPANRLALLPPVPLDLGQETWRLDFSGASGPQLLINNRLGDWKAIAASPMFRSLVYPAAMREVLWWAYKIEGETDTDDQDSWSGQWLRFASSLPGVDNPPESNDDNEWDVWINDAVDSFARKHQMADHFKGELERNREAN